MKCHPLAMTSSRSCTSPRESMMDASCIPIRVSGIRFEELIHRVDLGDVAILILGRTGATDIKATGRPTQEQRDVELRICVHWVINLNGGCKIIWVRDTDLGCVIDDHTIDAALHWAYQVIVH